VSSGGERITLDENVYEEEERSGERGRVRI